MSNEEKLLQAKELSASFQSRGVIHHEDYFRALIRDCPLSIRAKFISFPDAWTWWKDNPKWRPFSRKSVTGSVFFG